MFRVISGPVPQTSSSEISRLYYFIQFLFQHMTHINIVKDFLFFWFQVPSSCIVRTACISLVNLFCHDNQKKNILIFDFVKKFYCSQFNQSKFWPHMSKHYRPLQGFFRGETILKHVFLFRFRICATRAPAGSQPSPRRSCLGAPPTMR